MVGLRMGPVAIYNMASLRSVAFLHIQNVY